MRILKILFLCFIICNSYASSQDLIAASKPSDTLQLTTPDLKNLIKQFYQAMEDADTLKLGSLLSEDYQVSNLSSIQEGSYSKFTSLSKNLKIRAIALKNAFPDAKYEITQIFREGDKVVACSTLHGVHKGAFLGVAPTQKPIQIKYVHIFTIKNEKITHFSEMWNELSVMKQIGQIVL